jgi:polysaccharide export outer membrane protein
MMTPPSRLIAVLATAALAGCSHFPSYIPTSGPSADRVVETPAKQPDSGIQVIDLSDAVVKRVQASQRRTLLSEAFGSSATLPSFAVGMGDSLEVSVWEAPPAALFGSGITDTRSGLSTSSRVTVLPEQSVSATGTINMPFAGTLQVVGRSPEQIEQEIARRLKSKANDPQVLVRVIRNASSTVTVVGEVNTSARMPLSPKGERLLDALAASGGLRQPVGKITVQVTREVRVNGVRTVRVQSLPLDAIIADPAQNITLQPGDVVTVLHQPNSLTVLGATARNEEMNFEAQGITLAQALARAGGLQDQRANASGVFIFRYEDPAALPPEAATRLTADGKVPIVYRVDLRDPASFFTAQGFPMRNRDVMYVANAPGNELQKFLNIISSVVVPTVTIRNLAAE